MLDVALRDSEFRAIQQFLSASAGIALTDAKKALVSGRLGKRLRVHGFGSYSDYLDLIGRDRAERQIALDLLTTNETYFFREPKHFEFLQSTVLCHRTEIESPEGGRGGFRIWSAAASSGEEPYTLAMVLEAAIGRAPWEIIGTDISTRMLEKCRLARYPIEHAQHIPKPFLRDYCLRGKGPEEGFLRIVKPLRDRVRFLHANLNGELPALGKFDVIFLRNVMIYFDPETKRRLLQRLTEFLHPGGWLFISHTETLHGMANGLQQVSPSIYRKPSECSPSR